MNRNTNMLHYPSSLLYTSGLYNWFPVLHVIMNLRINTLPMLTKVVPEWRKFVLVSF